jgi:uracil-DNA glycosylase
MRNVYKALALAKPGFEPPLHADLTPWAQAGVLLLNTALTVEIGHAGSHLAIGWQAMTGAIVRSLLTRDSDPPHVLLWGKPAQTFFDDAANGVSINPAQVLRARHPSNDYQQQFPAQAAAQFLALSQAYPQIDWWALG